ncbi:MAG: hypothetical protein II800_00020, partial [Lachnospiraceae bacterium]|nr:hypothetical protein [Lachnospiraceae bacterium]
MANTVLLEAPERRDDERIQQQNGQRQLNGAPVQGNRGRDPEEEQRRRVAGLLVFERHSYESLERHMRIVHENSTEDGDDAVENVLADVFNLVRLLKTPMEATFQGRQEQYETLQMAYQMALGSCRSYLARRTPRSQGKRFNVYSSTNAICNQLQTEMARLGPEIDLAEFIIRHNHYDTTGFQLGELYNISLQRLILPGEQKKEPTTEEKRRGLKVPTPFGEGEKKEIPNAPQIPGLDPSAITDGGIALPPGMPLRVRYYYGGRNVLREEEKTYREQHREDLQAAPFPGQGVLNALDSLLGIQTETLPLAEAEIRNYLPAVIGLYTNLTAACSAFLAAHAGERENTEGQVPGETILSQTRMLYNRSIADARECGEYTGRLVPHLKERHPLPLKWFSLWSYEPSEQQQERSGSALPEIGAGDALGFARTGSIREALNRLLRVSVLQTKLTELYPEDAVNLFGAIDALFHEMDVPMPTSQTQIERGYTRLDGAVWRLWELSGDWLKAHPEGAREVVAQRQCRTVVRQMNLITDAMRDQIGRLAALAGQKLDRLAREKAESGGGVPQWEEHTWGEIWELSGDGDRIGQDFGRGEKAYRQALGEEPPVEGDPVPWFRWAADQIADVSLRSERRLDLTGLDQRLEAVVGILTEEIPLEESLFDPLRSPDHTAVTARLTEALEALRSTGDTLSRSFSGGGGTGVDDPLSQLTGRIATASTAYAGRLPDLFRQGLQSFLEERRKEQLTGGKERFDPSLPSSITHKWHELWALPAVSGGVRAPLPPFAPPVPFPRTAVRFTGGAQAIQGTLEQLDV